ncbi:ankyrin repeat domain-containing protein [Jeotgalibacillus sp. JSM ZJ347]|uniref:ankyrin repeat domain-containing protein n=1 Tax=Jeotgalibacillus sp. JSM ZJ347 TaxID=3342117 RepID=UPI0035A82333
MKKRILIALVVLLLAVFAVTFYVFGRPAEIDNEALFNAIAEGDQAAVSSMIENGQAVNLTNDAGMTAFQVSVTSLQPGVGELLLDEGADPSQEDAWLIAQSMIDPALDEEGINDQMFSLIQKLHEQDSDLIFELNDEDETLLFEAVRMHHEALFAWLTEQGVDTGAINSSGDTLFHTAARFPYKSVSFVTEFVSYPGGKVNGNSDMPITAAVKSNNPEWVRVFAEADEVNWQNQQGWTALMFASDYGFTESVSMLLELGADTDIENDNGNTAADLAANYDNGEILSLLNQN